MALASKSGDSPFLRARANYNHSLQLNHSSLLARTLKVADRYFYRTSATVTASGTDARTVSRAFPPSQRSKGRKKKKRASITRLRGHPAKGKGVANADALTFAQI